jgi:SAM-dependent methyltransferase
MFLDNFLRYFRYKQITKIIPSNSLICDLGCGNDFYIFKKISKKTPSYIWGFDKKIAEKKTDKVETKKLDLEKESIPLDNNFVDMVIMSAVLEHLDNPLIILKEAFRILKPKGFLILTTPGKHSKLILEFLAFKVNLIRKEDILEHKKYYSEEEIKNLLRVCGFEKEKIKIKKFEFGLNNLVVAEK